MTTFAGHEPSTLAGVARFEAEERHSNRLAHPRYAASRVVMSRQDPFSLCVFPGITLPRPGKFSTCRCAIGARDVTKLRGMWAAVPASDLSAESHVNIWDVEVMDPRLAAMILAALQVHGAQGQTVPAPNGLLGGSAPQNDWNAAPPSFGTALPHDWNVAHE
jgi:hypothetical protein